jgi:hypothetical protein
MAAERVSRFSFRAQRRAPTSTRRRVIRVVSAARSSLGAILCAPLCAMEITLAQGARDSMHGWNEPLGRKEGLTQFSRLLHLVAFLMTPGVIGMQ